MPYVRQCLDSVFSQTFRDFFVVLVDDGSTDFSYEFAKMYERKYPGRMKVLRLPEKRMAGGARNAGMDWPAECEYLYFLDSDDYLFSADVLEKLARDATAAGMPDMVLGSFAMDWGRGPAPAPVLRFVRESDALASSAWNSASAKIQRASAAERFLEGCMRGEDTYQWLRMLDKGATWSQVGYPIFSYRRHPSSATRSPAFAEDRPKFVAALRAFLPEAKDPWVAASIRRRCGL